MIRVGLAGCRRRWSVDRALVRGAATQRSIASCLCAGLVVLASGCSLFASGGPSPWRPRDGEPQCDPTPAMVADAVVAIGGLGLMIFGTALPNEHCNDSVCAGPIYRAFGAAVGAPAALASVIGLNKRSQCNEARTRWRRHQADVVPRLARGTGAAVTIETTPDAVVVLVLRTSEAGCADHRWMDSVRADSPALRAQGVTWVTCMAGTSLAWSGALDAPAPVAHD
jgi:hypothetical protein